METCDLESAEVRRRVSADISSIKGSFFQYIKTSQFYVIDVIIVRTREFPQRKIK